MWLLTWNWCIVGVYDSGDYSDQTFTCTQAQLFTSKLKTKWSDNTPFSTCRSSCTHSAPWAHVSLTCWQSCCNLSWINDKFYTLESNFFLFPPSFVKTWREDSSNSCLTLFYQYFISTFIITIMNDKNKDVIISFMQLELQQTCYDTLLILVLLSWQNCHFFHLTLFFCHWAFNSVDWLYSFRSQCFVSVRMVVDPRNAACEEGNGFDGKPVNHKTPCRQSLISKGNSALPIHLPACFWGGGRKQESGEKPTQMLENRQSSTQAVTQAQDQAREPGALRQQHYPLHHHTTLDWLRSQEKNCTHWHTVVLLVKWIHSRKLNILKCYFASFLINLPLQFNWNVI